MFRRRTADAPEATETGQQTAEPESELAEPESQAPRPGLTQPKGRPTPKRSEAERRRQPFTAPPDRKTAYRQSRGAGSDRSGNGSSDRGDRARRQEAMRRGEEWALLPKDKGPVRKLVRDYVDTRRGISKYCVFAMLLVAVLTFIGHAASSLVYVTYLLLIVIVAESWIVSSRAVRLVRQRYPGESTHGLRTYAGMRNLILRRQRVPLPQVKPGDEF